MPKPSTARAALAALALSLAAPVPDAGHAAWAQSVRGAESYRGFDVALLAEALARLTTLRTQHGEKPGEVEFERWLAGKGRTRADYESAYASWWERFRADPTGQLEARFHRINSEWVQQLNFADAPDRRLETREGVTLDTYARIAVELTRLPGKPIEEVLKRHGVKDAAHWQRVNEAWGKAMKEDTTFALVQQYGALYQKYAGAQFTAEQDALLAGNLAEHNRKETPAPAPPPKPPTIDDSVARMKAASGRERWSAAREYAHACDLWSGPSRSDPKDPRAPFCARARLKSDLAPVILEAVERSDDDTIGFNVGLLDYLTELGLVDDEARMTAKRALRRASDRLATLEASFAPIRDKAVPERMTLRVKIDENTAAGAELARTLANWSKPQA